MDPSGATSKRRREGEMEGEIGRIAWRKNRCTTRAEWLRLRGTLPAPRELRAARERHKGNAPATSAGRQAGRRERRQLCLEMRSF